MILIIGTTRGSTKPKKSTKFPDPPILINRKDPKFTNWLLKIKAKFRANKNYYNIEKLKIAYVKSRIKKNASRYFAPRLKKENNQF